MTPREVYNHVATFLARARAARGQPPARPPERRRRRVFELAPVALDTAAIPALASGKPQTGTSPVHAAHAPAPGPSAFGPVNIVAHLSLTGGAAGGIAAVDALPGVGAGHAIPFNEDTGVASGPIDDQFKNRLIEPYFKPFTGTWIETTHLVASAGDAGHTPQAVLGTATASYASCTATCVPEADGASQSGLFICGAIDDATGKFSGYVLYWDQDAEVVQLSRFDNDAETTLAGVADPLILPDPLTLSLVFDASTGSLTATFGTRTIGPIIDATYTSGKAGLFSQVPASSWSRFTITPA